jgi:hypothetical protein
MDRRHPDIDTSKALISLKKEGFRGISKGCSKPLLRETQKAGVSEKRSISERSSLTAIDPNRSGRDPLLGQAQHLTQPVREMLAAAQMRRFSSPNNCNFPSWQ